jgi:hypothetical protein
MTIGFAPFYAIERPVLAVNRWWRQRALEPRR